MSVLSVHILSILNLMAGDLKDTYGPRQNVMEYFPRLYFLTGYFALDTRSLSVPVFVSASQKLDYFRESSFSGCSIQHLAAVVDIRLSLTLWYPRHVLQMRVGLFFAAASLAGAQPLMAA